MVQPKIQLCILVIGCKNYESYEKEMNKIEYCNWEFRDCLKKDNKWVLKRDCDEEETTITRGSGVKWRKYQMSLEPTYVGQPPKGECHTCGKYINAVNTSDDGETWRK